MLDDEQLLRELDSLEEKARSKDDRVTHQETVQGSQLVMVQFKIDINYPKYRMENGRTIDAQDKFKYLYPNKADAFDDPSSQEAQQLQHSILVEMAEESDLRKLLLAKGQTRPILLRHDGYVMDGNRRLAAMREIHRLETKGPKPDFAYVTVARLPELPAKEIQSIETRLQDSKDGKAEYFWVSKIRNMDRNINEFGMSKQEVAREMNHKVGTVEERLEMFKLMTRYLESIGTPLQYFSLGAEEQAFKTLAKGMKRYESNKILQNQVIDLCFNIIRHNESGDSKHKRILTVVDDLQTVIRQTASLIPSAKELTENTPSIFVDSHEKSDVQLPKLIISEENSRVIHQAVRDAKRKKEVEDIANSPAKSISEANSLLSSVKFSSETKMKKQIQGQLKAIGKQVEELLKQLKSVED